jgi:hypothetical protein
VDSPVAATAVARSNGSVPATPRRVRNSRSAAWTAGSADAVPHDTVWPRSPRRRPSSPRTDSAPSGPSLPGSAGGR